MRLLHNTQAERIVGGSPTININTMVSNSVGPTTVMTSSTVVAKPKINARTTVANQNNVAVGVIAYGGVNTSFSASQVFAQINDLTP